MLMKNTKQMSETFRLGILLAIVGGFLDAYTYITRGAVFANAQTGNIVLLGLNIAEGRFKDSIYYLIPILAFALGVIISEVIKSKNRNNNNLHWRQIVIVIEIVILFIIGFIPCGNMNIFVNVAISFVCSMQVETFRKVNGNAFATTMCTGNLRSGTEQLYKYQKTKDKNMLYKSLQYYGIILFFILGAVIGTFGTNMFNEKSILFCCAILLLAFIIMFKDEVKALRV